MACFICDRITLRPGGILPICDEHLSTMLLEASIGPRGQYLPIPRPEAVW